MTTTRRHSPPLAGAILVVIAALAAGALSLTPLVPGVRATDPTDAASQSPDPGPTPAPDPDPTAQPSTDPAPTSEPSDGPSSPPAEPSASPPAEPSASATPEPSASGSPEPSASGSPPVTDPPPDPSSSPSAEPVTDPLPSPTPAPSASPSVSPPIAGEVAVDGYAVARVSRVTGEAAYGPAGVPLQDAERYRPLRLRLHLTNGTFGAVALSPRLEYSGPGDGGAYRPVPFNARIEGEAFYARPDRAVTADIPAGGTAEFTVDLRATVDAEWLGRYTFRLVDRTVPVAMRVDPAIEMGSKPPIALSPNQFDGASVQSAGLRYPLLGSDAIAVRAPTSTGDASPHGNYTLVTDACAACHRSHDGQSQRLGSRQPAGATICFQCHSAVGSASDVERQFGDPAIPPNDPAQGAWFAHPATVPSGHVSDAEDEFSGRLDRHADCADCHDPHRAGNGLAIETAAGWARSGALDGVSGIVLVPGEASAPPAYVRTESSALEYELCLKCHSASTQLPAGDPAHPSRWALDKGREIDPQAASFHPIAAPGTNAGDAVTNSLAGSSPYKLWNFPVDATIRCQNCHGDPARATPVNPPAAGDRLSAHASPNRGLLMAPYRDRSLPARGSAYAAADFALCYQCHGESPYVDPSGDSNPQTSFSFHGLHVSGIALTGAGGTDIDIAGAGQGNAVCAECHFRIHGTALAVNPGDRDNARLANFAPNVEPLNGTLSWTQAGAGGTCTLVCHGVSHDGETYGP